MNVSVTIYMIYL